MVIVMGTMRIHQALNREGTSWGQMPSSPLTGNRDKWSQASDDYQQSSEQILVTLIWIKLPKSTSWKLSTAWIVWQCGNLALGWVWIEKGFNVIRKKPPLIRGSWNQSIALKDWSWSSSYDHHSHYGGDGFRLCVSLKGASLLQGVHNTVGEKGGEEGGSIALWLSLWC